MTPPLTELAKSVAGYMLQHELSQLEFAARSRVSQATISRLLSGTLESIRPATLARLLKVVSPAGLEAAAELAQQKLVSPRIQIGFLDVPTQKLADTTAELAEFDDFWLDPATNLLALLGVAGSGKTSLAFQWIMHLRRSGWRGVEAIMGWSFSASSFASERAPSFEVFLDEALAFFGDSDAESTQPRSKVIRLAELIRRQRAVVVLDALEHLQVAPSEAGTVGAFKVPELLVLLRELAVQNSGLVILTSRLPLPELRPFRDDGCCFLCLEPLTAAEGAKLLAALGIRGSEFERRRLSEELGGHPLCLGTAARYLCVASAGDPTEWRADSVLAAARVLREPKVETAVATYLDWFGGREKRSLLWSLAPTHAGSGSSALEIARRDDTSSEALVGERTPSSLDTRLFVEHLRQLFLLPASSSGDVNLGSGIGPLLFEGLLQEAEFGSQVSPLSNAAVRSHEVALTASRLKPVG